MSLPAGPKLELIEATETTISVEFKPVESIEQYELEWKAIEGAWTKRSGAKTVQSSGGKKIKGEAVDLEPGMTYCIRAACMGSGGKGQPGPELIIDTEQVGCTPKAEKSCCVIQ